VEDYSRGGRTIDRCETDALEKGGERIGQQIDRICAVAVRLVEELPCDRLTEATTALVRHHDDGSQKRAVTIQFQSPKTNQLALMLNPV
jgi:hypothetical protein